MASHVSFRPVEVAGHWNAERLGAKLAKSAVKLSEGVRADRAAQGAPEGRLSETLRAVVSDLDVVQRSISDAANMTKVAEVSLSDAAKALREAQSLAVQATSPALTDIVRRGLQVEWNAVMHRLDGVADMAAYAGHKLLTGGIGNDVHNTQPACLVGLNIVTAGLQAGAIGVDVVAAAGKARIVVPDLPGPAAPVAPGPVTINDTPIGSFTTASTVGDVVEAVNARSEVTGVTARLETSEAAHTRLVLEAVEYGAANSITVLDPGGSLLGSPGTAEAAGRDAVARVTIGGEHALWDAGNGLTLKSPNGDTIELTEAAGTAVTDLGTVATLKPGGYTFETGPDTEQLPGLVINSVTSNALGLAEVDLSTTDGAADAVRTVERALDRVSSDISRVSNYRREALEVRSQALAVARENVAASHSTLSGPSFSQEMLETAAAQVLVQAAVAFSAQAQTLPHTALELTQ